MASEAVEFDGPNDAAPPRLSQAELEDVRDAFQLLDVNNTKKILVEDLMDVLKEMLQETTTSSSSRRWRGQLQQIYSVIASQPTDRLLTESEFCQLLVADDEKEDDIEKVFRLYSDGKDYIDLQDLQRVADELGESMSAAELQEMLAVEGNEENNNKVTLEQFAEIMNKKLMP